jgi:aminoglycoside phosphotransferase (APT) family kinase protein
LSRADTWADFLKNHLRASDRLAVLVQHAMLDRRAAKAVRDCVATMQRWSGPPVLQHGDLRLKNLLVDRDGKVVALIDWDDCLSAIGPHWDLALALHDLSIDQKQAFLDGYGMPDDAVRAAAPFWKALNILNYAPVIEGLAEAGDERTLAAYRLRLAGAFDLYSL